MSLELHDQQTKKEVQYGTAALDDGPSLSHSKSEPQSPLLTVLRWIAFVPAAIVAAPIAGGLVILVNQDGRFFEPDSFLDQLVVKGLGNGVLGGVFVYVGVFIVPRHKRHVAIALAGTILVLAGALLLPAILLLHVSGIASLICMGFGACCTAYSIVTSKVVVGSVDG